MAEMGSPPDARFLDWLAASRLRWHGVAFSLVAGVYLLIWWIA